MCLWRGEGGGDGGGFQQSAELRERVLFYGGGVIPQIHTINIFYVFKLNTVELLIH